MLNPWWPLSAVRVVTPRLELRYVDEDLSIALVDLADQGVHDPGTMPFSVAWTDEPAPQRQWNSMRHYAAMRADCRPGRWRIELAVLVDGVVVGASGVRAHNFPVTRTVETGSWLGRVYQGQGIGTEARAATLHLAFAGFGAERAVTKAFDDNPASLGVTRKLGYQPNGDEFVERRGAAARLLAFALDRPAWERTRRDDIELTGVAAAREFLEIP